MKTIGVFDPGRVIDSFRLEEILKIHEDPERELIDILPNQPRGKIVNKWLMFWTKKKVPWAVTLDADHLISVWKESYL